MRRILGLLALLALLAVVAVAANAAAGPPGSGDWVIGGTEAESNSQLRVNNGDIIITGTLSLTNCDLEFRGGTSYEINVNSRGTLNINGGTIGARAGSYTIVVRGTCNINGCTITDSRGIQISSTWDAKVRNCTIVRPDGDGISAVPGGVYNLPMDLSDNKISNASGYGIYVNIDSMSQPVRIAIVGNNVTGSVRDGIHCTANTNQARIYLERNEVYRAGGNGIYVWFNGHLSGIRLDSVEVCNCTQDGIYIYVYGSTYLTKYVDDVWSFGNGGRGVYVNFANQHWRRPEFRRWHIEDNEDAGVHFRNIECATFEDGYNRNDRAANDYEAVNTDIWCFRMDHRKARAQISGTWYFVVSWRYLNLRATWQNGAPCSYNQIEFENSAGNRVFSYNSNDKGELGNHTEWDWTVGPTRTHTRSQLSAFMLGGFERLSGPTIDFDQDFDEDLVFMDMRVPDLYIDSPPSNHIQKYENLTIEGTCFDPHSHPRLVQVSFDDEANWNRKIWYNATDTTSWSRTFPYWPDGTYTIYVRAYDWANYPNGAFANMTITNVTIDTEPPILTIIQPIPYWTITNVSQYTVLGVTDPDVVQVTLNGEPLNIYGSNFNKALALHEGDNTLIWVASDYAGNIAKVMKHIYLDSIAPILVVQYPKEGLRTNQRELDVGGLTDLTGVNITVNDEPATVRNGIWTHTVFLKPGYNKLWFDAVDNASNHRYEDREVIYDPDPPDILVAQPKPNTVIASNQILIRGMTSPDILDRKIRINEIFIGIDAVSQFNYTLNVIRDGPLDILIEAWDLAGNYNNVTIPVVIDTTAPYIYNISIDDYEIVNTPTLTISGETEPDAELEVQGSYVTLSNGYFSKEVHLVEGRNPIELMVTDQAGNSRIVTRNIDLDTDIPLFELRGITGNSTTVTAGFISLKGKVEEKVDMTITIDGVKEVVYVKDDGDFDHPIILSNRTTVATITTRDYAGNEYSMDLVINREEEEAPSYFKEHPEVIIGIIAIVVALVVAFPMVRYGMDATYKRRLKIMGYGAQEDVDKGVQTAHARPPGPPPRGPPPRGPPRPPMKDEGPPPRELPRPPESGE